MKHSELRIGNLVFDDKYQIHCVNSIRLQSELSGSWPVVGMENYVFYYPDDLKPIPLSKEWLCKFGFTEIEEWESGTGKNYYRKDKKLVIAVSPRHGISISTIPQYSSYAITYMIDHVHELQNIYKDLTGDEIECNINFD